MTLLLPKEIRKIGTTDLKITWNDLHQSLYPFPYLRQNCRCAFCIDERSGKQILIKDNVNPNLEAFKVTPVGQYALRIDFSDGHNTGLYTLQHLRQLCPCKECS